ncbi:hypothetical protein CALCODRAFT_104474 [Calocera cornea HHB12733]|uniref:Uncharacterized protein n=1 Tax=Calocera cornea HHB12733 TaxID=1353952 RepID=A0A165D3T1_9BASI|nr:hypothetical protein CALCODRAFT_104474 [Calocera cornea HHB12733]
MARPDSPDGSDRACPTLNISLRDCRWPSLKGKARRIVDKCQVLDSRAYLLDQFYGYIVVVCSLH